VTRHMIVGLDPGVTTGLAVWDAQQQRLTAVESMGIVAAMLRVQSMMSFGSLHSVVFEDARLRAYFGNKGREALQGAGSIKRDCGIWVEWFEHVGCAYRAISPRQKGAKLNATQFQMLTLWEGRTNDHGRDAALLVLGRTACTPS